MKDNTCHKIMKLRETKWETQPIPRAGLSCSVRARPLGVSRAAIPLPLKPPVLSTRTVLKTPRTSVIQNPVSIRTCGFESHLWYLRPARHKSLIGNT